MSPSIGDRIANLTARLPSFGGRGKRRAGPSPSGKTLNGHHLSNANGQYATSSRQVPLGLRLDPPQQIPAHPANAQQPPSFEDAAAIATAQPQRAYGAGKPPYAAQQPAQAVAQPQPVAQPQDPAPQQLPAPSAGALALADNEWLAAHGLEKSFGRRRVVKGVSLGVRRGEVVGLLGPNGAGKTTTFYMITGLIAADGGAIEIDGYDVTHLPMYRRARLGVGYLPQEPSIFRGMTVEQNIMAVLELVEPDRKRRRNRLDKLLEEFNISRLRKSPSIALSGGERRRVEIARALASNPVFMLLDEPFAGIDPIAVNDIRALVRHLTSRGIGVLITDHNVRETLGLIDRAYIIHDGQVLMEGPPQAVVANEQVRRFYLGEDFKL
ncbi:MAG: LPS export ABC transporter ATP-binding protein [Pseudomonadota bacterium]